MKSFRQYITQQDISSFSDKEQINEIGDTPRGREFLQHYISARGEQIPALAKELSTMSDRADELTADMRATRMRKSPNPQHMASLGKKGKSLEKILVRKIGRTERIVKGIQRASQIISP